MILEFRPTALKLWDSSAEHNRRVSAGTFPRDTIKSIFLKFRPSQHDMDPLFFITDLLRDKKSLISQ